MIATKAATPAAALANLLDVIVVALSGSFASRDRAAEIIRNLYGDGEPWIRLTATGKERQRRVKCGTRCSFRRIRQLPRKQAGVILLPLSRSPQTHVRSGHTRPRERCRCPRQASGILEGNRRLSGA